MIAGPFVDFSCPFYSLFLLNVQQMVGVSGGTLTGKKQEEEKASVSILGDWINP